MAKKNTLLIVDDYEFNRLMLSDMFPNYDIIEAENGFRAMEEYEKNKDKICCVLSDIMMPVMDGFGLLDYFFKNKVSQRVPVFIISADTSKKAVTKAFELGAEDIIAKPFDIKFVRKHIENIIELYKFREYYGGLPDDDFDEVSTGNDNADNDGAEETQIDQDADFSATSD